MKDAALQGQLAAIEAAIEAENDKVLLATMRRAELEKARLALVEAGVLDGAQWVNVKRAAHIGRRSQRTIFRWLDDGKLLSIELSGRRFISRSSLENVTTNVTTTP